MIEMYPTLRLRDEYIQMPGLRQFRDYTPLRWAAELYLLPLWFATSLITNILVTGLIISRIFRQLSLTDSSTGAR